eukprot:3934457-Rhodomonas_salina.2
MDKAAVHGAVRPEHRDRVVSAPSNHGLGRQDWASGCSRVVGASKRGTHGAKTDSTLSGSRAALYSQPGFQ